MTRRQRSRSHQACFTFANALRQRFHLSVYRPILKTIRLTLHTSQNGWWLSKYIKRYQKWLSNRSDDRSLHQHCGTVLWHVQHQKSHQRDQLIPPMPRTMENQRVALNKSHEDGVASGCPLPQKLSECKPLNLGPLRPNSQGWTPVTCKAGPQ